MHTSGTTSAASLPAPPQPQLPMLPGYGAMGRDLNEWECYRLTDTIVLLPVNK